MEKAKWHLPLFVILYIVSSSVRSVGNIFTACVQGKFSAVLPYNIFETCHLTENIKLSVFLALSRKLVILSFGCGMHTTKLTRDL